MDYNFTANAEDALDHIAEGEVEWQSMIGTFYQPFHANVEKTLKESERNTGARELGKDPQTGETVSVRIGRFGPMAQIGEGESRTLCRTAQRATDGNHYLGRSFRLVQVSPSTG